MHKVIYENQLAELRDWSVLLKFTDVCQWLLFFHGNDVSAPQKKNFFNPVSQTSIPPNIRLYQRQLRERSHLPS